MTDIAVNAEGLVKVFGQTRAVDRIDLEVRRGEIFGVLGPNGAGKTTMLRMLATLLRIDEGSARIFGADVRSQPHLVRQLVGVTGQYASVDENLTAQENLWLFARLQGIPSTQARRRATALIEQFGLTEAADRQIAKFSGGMRRRLDLAASLINLPPLIFLDEPTTGLDPRTRASMYDTIRDLAAEGCTVLLTTQYLDEADQLADRVAVIDRGRKVAEGTTDELKASIGGSTLRLRFTHPEELGAAAAIIRRLLAEEPLPNRATPADGGAAEAGLAVALSDANQAAEVLIALRQGAISITSVTVQQPTLDEVFLALTGHGAEDDPRTGPPDIRPEILPEMEVAR